MVTVASRPSLVGALLRNVAASQRVSLVDFLRGLSRDELECLAEFEGSCVLESQDAKINNMYQMLASFFDSAPNDRWANPDERAHKTFVLLEYLNILELSKLRIAINR